MGQTFEETWAAVFKACADFGVQLEASLLKPSMVTPGAQSGVKADAETIASCTLAALKHVREELRLLSSTCSVHRSGTVERVSRGEGLEPSGSPIDRRSCKAILDSGGVGVFFPDAECAGK